MIGPYDLEIRKAAQRWGVSPDIHPEDFIYKFVFDHPGFCSKEEAISYYFNDGARSAQKLNAILTEICGLGAQPIELLEFASGYGCVTRHIGKTIPFCSLTACDIHPQAVSFIRDTFDTPAILSSSQPEGLNPGGLFDVVFALSFFSHMPKTTFSRWVRALASCLKPGGYLIVTTHGLISRESQSSPTGFDYEGFYFAPGCEQKDLPEQEYGVTFVLPQYMFGCLSGIPNLALTYFHQGTWWDHQDLYVARALSEDINRLPQLNRRDRVKLRLVPLLSPLGRRIPPTLRQWIKKLVV